MHQTDPETRLLLAKKLVEYADKADEFFWNEDACAPAMDASQLNAAVDKSNRIYGALGLASRKLGVSHGEVAQLFNSTPLVREIAGRSRKDYIAERVAGLSVRKELVGHVVEIQQMWNREARKDGDVNKSSVKK